MRLEDEDDRITRSSRCLLFPALIALVWIIGLLGSSVTDSLLSNISDLSPGPAREILSSAVKGIA